MMIWYQKAHYITGRRQDRVCAKKTRIHLLYFRSKRWKIKDQLSHWAIFSRLASSNSCAEDQWAFTFWNYHILFYWFFSTIRRLRCISDTRQLSLWHSSETYPRRLGNNWFRGIWRTNFRLTANFLAIRLWFVRKRAPMGSEWAEAWWEERRTPGWRDVLTTGQWSLYYDRKVSKLLAWWLSTAVALWVNTRDAWSSIMMHELWIDLWSGQVIRGCD